MTRLPARWGRLLVTVLLLVPRPLSPAVITVGGSCNLNAAITAANTDSPSGGCPAGSGTDRLQLTGPVTLTAVDNDTDGPNGLPSVTSVITLDGNGHSVVRGAGSPAFRILHIAEDGDLTIRDVTVSSGQVIAHVARGGGVFNRGDLALSNTTVGSSGALGRAWAQGGGIHNLGSLELYRSTVNTSFAIASGDGSEAYALGGGISGSGSLSISASTLSDNYAAATGGVYTGAYGGAVQHGGSFLSIVGSTLSGNSATALAGGLVYGGAVDARNLFGGPVSISNSTISNNLACLVGPGGCTPAGAIVDAQAGTPGTIQHVTFMYSEAAYALRYASASGSVFSMSSNAHCYGVADLGGNIADSATCAVGIPDNLGSISSALSDNGGPTLTHELFAGSTAIDIAGSCGLADQRGAGRISPCDSGAFEEIGCVLLELDDQTINAGLVWNTCNTALLGPNLVIGGGGSVTVTAGYLITIHEGLRVETGGELELGIDPTLLP